MTKSKQLIFLLLLFIVVGIAVVSTNIIINGSTPLASNPDDFSVYFSNVLVNGTQDLSLVQSETSLVFTGEFSAVGDKKEITYDVTNASKNYDADIEITCTPSTTYLTISNSFDTSTNLPATSTRTGVLSITLSKSYTGADLTQDISCTITASAVERTSQGSGSVATPVNPLYIGREISIGEEKFNVISVGNDTITMLAQYNIGTDYKQTQVKNYVTFSNNNGWNTSSDVDIQSYDGNAKTILNAYVEYLRQTINTSSSNLVGDFITLKQFQSLGCVVQDDHSYTGIETCVGSPYNKWLVSGQEWWTRSSGKDYDNSIWLMLSDGSLNGRWYASTNGAGIRPVIELSRETALALIKYKTYAIGEEISIGDEKFNVISQTSTSVKMLAQYNLGTDYRQSELSNYVTFSSDIGWEHTPGPKEIDIQEWSSNPKKYVNEYVTYLREETNDVNLSGDLITVLELKMLGFETTSDYSYIGGLICRNLDNKEWLINGQDWWTRSAVPMDGVIMMIFDEQESLYDGYYSNEAGIRPVITISKEYLE